MSTRQLLPEQAAAAYEIRKHISVTAGPGSGKTTVLVERYLHILRQQNLSIDQIVAITFTNRAANEMRERLRRELSEILRTSSPRERGRWLNFKRTLDGAVITTIHGFCARLLREFPIEARIDPQFLLLDEHRAAMLLESVVEDVLSTFISGGHVEISRLTLGVGRSKLALALAQLYRDVRGQGLTLRELAAATATVHASEDAHANALHDLDRAMDAFLAVPRSTANARAKLNDVLNAWPTIQQLVQTIPSHETLADFCRDVESFRDHRPQARPPLAEHINVVDELIWLADLKGRVPQLCLDIFAKQYALEMVNLLITIEKKLDEEKRKLAALDFDDLEVRTLELLERSEVISRAAERYRFFLVDEFQDTNDVQRKLLERLALKRERANLFIVGDRKQSIYGFRGADVDVFREMTLLLLQNGGEEKPLQLNFRSQPPLIYFFNFLFSRLFSVPEDISEQERGSLHELGYVAHEPGEAKRELKDQGPLVEFLVTTRVSTEDDTKSEQDSRLLDAQQVALRIKSIMRADPDLNYSNFALLFRAMTQVQLYESAFRRANIPYQTVLGRGFYAREEVTDLIQLLRFLDNKTDELALAAILRSPLCGISDNALFALRCAPKTAELVDDESSRNYSSSRNLYRALRQHSEIAYISDDEHQLLDRAAKLISRLIARRHHFTIEALLRFAVDESEYMQVAAANFDGAQRLANVQRLFTLAARFENSGAHLIRDFVRYVEEFEEIGSRESEGQIDEAANAVRLMTIHQAKGLEFRVVVIPDLHRLSRVSNDNWVILDRHKGLTLKVPDGRGRLVAGCTYSEFEKRHNLREHFESMRLLYVAATRAEDRLILSGVTEQLSSLSGRNDSWIKWIWQALNLEGQSQSGIVELAPELQLQLTINLADEPVVENDPPPTDPSQAVATSGESLSAAFPLLQPVTSGSSTGGHRFSVTQLINYQRCPRQYYFDRVLRLPSTDELGVWNNAEAPEPPANLTATLKGAVIHRFCEQYTSDQAIEDSLRRCFEEVVRARQATLADRLGEIDAEAAIKELLPLASNYLSSDLFHRVENARAGTTQTERPAGELGLWSELSFRLRRPLGVLNGVIDKLLVTRSPEGRLEVEIIDFKTNRISTLAGVRESTSEPAKTVAVDTLSRRTVSQSQFAFDFDTAPATTTPVEPARSVDDATRVAAHDYQLQMQAYALAVRDLMPEAVDAKVKVTLHFLQPNLEVHLSDELLERDRCEVAIDEAMSQIISSSVPSEFPVHPAPHCRMCNFLNVCIAGREFVRSGR
jgi:ATP-dependent helicase/nuclease subunit A